MTEILLVLALLVFASVYISWRAGRLDRLHIRLETAWEALDAALVRRSATALELAASRLLDPATSLVLAASAHEARTAGGDERELAESNLSRTLRAVVEQPRFRERMAGDEVGAELMADLDAASAKVLYSRRFYNNAVAVTRSSRRRLLARLLRLEGHTPMPSFFDMDDTPPEGLSSQIS
ncbi:hypothetical protein [Rhizohabitans arisaemae]|uniref:hypothetical protein n=1 Tax=Rhizohabitans arisaemae TaxID=2720610 RepID=UPI0024B266C6|nr:hypothetical protein [Rhizohabitans arisaemae]